MTHSTSHRSYFDYRRKLHVQLSTLADQLNFNQEIDSIIVLVRNDQPVAAEHKLENLKQDISACLQRLASTLARWSGDLHQKNMELVATEREMIEHAQMIALASVNEEMIAKLDEQLASMDQLFTAGIADLDFEPEKT